MDEDNVFAKYRIFLYVGDQSYIYKHRQQKPRICFRYFKFQGRKLLNLSSGLLKSEITKKQDNPALHPKEKSTLTPD